MPSLPALLLFLPLLFSRPHLTASRPAPDEKHEATDRAPVLIPHHPTDTWRSFHRFLNLERGSHVSGMSELKRYFHRFGYLLGPAANFTDLYDARFESAVALYQSNLGLPVTGRLDAQTLTQIMTPRCGFNDSDQSTSGPPGVKRFAFFPGQPRWARPRPMTLTYAVSPDNTIDYIGKSAVDAAVRKAFDRWARVIPMNFVAAADYVTADVKLGFYGGDHGDGEPFDGVLGVLAHAFSPQSGRLHLDAAERWAVDFGEERSKVAVDLESVATHEIGHVLGLTHSAVREAVMYPSLSPRTRKVELTVDDVEGVQALYGSNPNFKFNSLMESDTSSGDSLASYSSIIRRSSIGIFGVIAMVCL